MVIYATSSGEETPELPRPPGAEPGSESYHSLFTDNLVKVMQGLNPPVTYRELMAMLTQRYREERGDRPPTVSAEGDLDVDVLTLPPR